MNITIRPPQSDEEFRELLNLRYTILREPWKQPIGSESDSLDLVATHAIAVTDEGKIVGTARLHANSGRQSQLRFLAVTEEARKQGVARKLVEYLLEKARESGAKYLRAQARESAVGFFLKQGFVVKGEGKMLFDEIKHFWVQKDI
jgi:N-acetylglutamate synthase-like GNAT family acetyltransferase